VKLEEAPEEGAAEISAPSPLRSAIEGFVADLRRRMNTGAPGEKEAQPSIYEVLAQSLNIMQVRITRTRMAGDPPELLVTPRLADFGLLDFDRAQEAIAEGERAVARALSGTG
jgi:NTE family protein